MSRHSRCTQEGPRSAFSFAPKIPAPQHLPSSVFKDVPPVLHRGVIASANSALSAFQDLNRGEVSSAESGFGTLGDWRRSRETGRRVSFEVLRGVVSDVEVGGQLTAGEGSPSVEEDEAAFRFMMSKDGGECSGDVSSDAIDLAGVDSMP